MAQQELVLWIDRRWKNAIEKHLNGETLQEHLENVLRSFTCRRVWTSSQAARRVPA